MKNLITIITGILLLGISVSAQESILAPSKNPTHRFDKVAEGVYFVVGTGSTIFVHSNSMMIEGDRDVLLVDSHTTPAAARALINAVKDVTKKPVRYLVNTHFHFDHTFGNQVFPEGVDIIGHEYTREKLAVEGLSEPTYVTALGRQPARLETIRKKIEASSDADEKKHFENQLKVITAHVEAFNESDPTPPNVTFDSKMSMFYGGREVQLLFLGRGHTGGDVVVFLPEEKMAFGGDLILPFLPYMADAFVDEWPATLERLKSLDIETIYPGHGEPIPAKETITNLQRYLSDLWTRTNNAKERGLTADEAAQEIDMTDHNQNFPQIKKPGVSAPFVDRIYQRIEMRPNESRDKP
jgi:glyoxylase-like metal-dependent hydrolase (beta-lactamase superfamily II)